MTVHTSPWILITSHPPPLRIRTPTSTPVPASRVLLASRTALTRLSRAQREARCLDRRNRSRSPWVRSRLRWCNTRSRSRWRILRWRISKSRSMEIVTPGPAANLHGSLFRWHRPAVFPISSRTHPSCSLWTFCPTERSSGFTRPVSTSRLPITARPCSPPSLSSGHRRPSTATTFTPFPVRRRPVSSAPFVLRPCLLVIPASTRSVAPPTELSISVPLPSLGSTRTVSPSVVGVFAL